MRIITLLNQKGGTGKTTTCINVGAALSRCGLKCLLIDIDPQGSLSSSGGFDELSDGDMTTYEVLNGEDINRAIKSSKNGYDMLPTDIRLSAGEIELVNADRRNYLLKDALSKLKKSYDFVLIDCPPSLNIFTLMALTAATEVIIPVQAQYLPLKGVAQIRETVELVKERFNPELEVGGVLLTFYDERRNLDKDVLEALEQAFEGKVYETKISQNTKIAEAPSYGKDVINYSINSKGSVQYRALAAEILGHETTEREI
jgi:chromosome partitioning protein